MKFTAALTCLLATGAAAFSPKSYVPNKSGLMVPPTAQDGASNNNSPLWRPGMNVDMVAGGAERSYGQEYYEGRLHLVKSDSYFSGRAFEWIATNSFPLVFG